MVWDENENMARADLEQLQMERLQSTLYRVMTHVPFYRNKYSDLKIDAESFTSLDDLSKLPFTTKQDLRNNYPYGMFAVPLRDVVRIHSSSGTTGMATVVGYTRKDIDTWSNLVARILTAAGVGKEDVIQIAFGYGLFTGGFGLHYGAEKLGASVIPISAGNTRRQIQIMQDFKTSALVCTPSYALKIADVMMDLGINPNGLSLKYGLFGAEPWSEKMREEISERLGIVATDNYGLSEVMGPGVAGECQDRGSLGQMFFEELDGARLGQFGLRLVVTRCGVVVEAVFGFRIHMMLERFIVLHQCRFEIRPHGVDSLVILG